MNIFKKIMTTFLTALITIVVIYGGYTIFASETYDDFENPALGFLLVKTTYHANMNTYFDAKISHLKEILDEPEFSRHQDFKTPEDVKDCTETNVSTYCVSMGALDLYIRYLKTLKEVKGYLIIPEDEAPFIGEVLGFTHARDDEIDREIHDARRVLDAALATYNEFRLAYPLHTEYEKVIDNLVKYKLALRDIRLQVSKFPGKFIDSTSESCE